MARRTPPRKVTYFEPVPPRLARNTVIESTFEVGRRFRCTMRIDCGQLDPGAVIRPVAGEWEPRYAGAPRRRRACRLARRPQRGLSARGADDRRASRGRRRIRRERKTPAGEAGVFKPDDRHGDFDRPRGIKQHRSMIVQVDDSPEAAASYRCGTGRRISAAGLSSRRPSYTTWRRRLSSVSDADAIL